jgi:DnaJ-domain-containing protein 1
MTLDHDTGRMEGTILRGRFAGMRLEELGPADLLVLLRECRAEDEEGARLLEAYLDRVHPEWRDELAGERAGGASGGGARSTSGDMSVDEAYAILGLAAGADAEAIKEAHRRLMVKLHPDHGGSDYLATKINRARDVLLHR